MPFRFRRIPLLAALLNFLVWGLGYLYNGKRFVFGGLLVVGSLLFVVFSLVLLPRDVASQANEALLVPGLIVSLALAYDAHAECRRMQKREKNEWEL